MHYRNASGRNDLVLMKVARHTTNLYFYAQTRQNLTPCAQSNWMLLFIKADLNARTGWEGYDFVLNRTIEGQESWLERNTGGWNWEKVVKMQLKVEANQLMLAVPRAALGLASEPELSFEFKWWDNLQQPGNIMDVYLSGDVAPDGRFNYRYSSGKLPLTVSAQSNR